MLKLLYIYTQFSCEVKLRSGWNFADIQIRSSWDSNEIVIEKRFSRDTDEIYWISHTGEKIWNTAETLAEMHVRFNRDTGEKVTAQSTYLYIYKEYHSVCPLVGVGALPTPLSPASVPLPPEPRGAGGRAHSPAGEGLGESQFRRLEKKLSTLLTLWVTVFYPMPACS